MIFDLQGVRQASGFHPQTLQVICNFWYRKLWGQPFGLSSMDRWLWTIHPLIPETWWNIYHWQSDWPLGFVPPAGVAPAPTPPLQWSPMLVTWIKLLGCGTMWRWKICKRLIFPHKKSFYLSLHAFFCSTKDPREYFKFTNSLQIAWARNLHPVPNGLTVPPRQPHPVRPC